MAVIDEINETNFENLVLKSDKLTLVDFYAQWCGPCRKMSPVLEQIQNEMTEDIKIVKMDADKCPNTASEYGVFSLPSMIIFKNGEVKEVMVGLMPKSSVISNIQKYV